jgi:hypothetical protein
MEPLFPKLRRRRDVASKTTSSTTPTTSMDVGHPAAQSKTLQYLAIVLMLMILLELLRFGARVWRGGRSQSAEPE